LLILVRSLAMDYHLDKKLSRHLFTPSPFNGWDTEKRGVATSTTQPMFLQRIRTTSPFPIPEKP
jgi:hypothetical protein